MLAKFPSFKLVIEIYFHYFMQDPAEKPLFIDGLYLE